MKWYLPLLACCLLAVHTSAQTIDSVFVWPENPTTADEIFLVGIVRADSSPLTLKFHTVATPSSNLRVVDACYEYGSADSVASSQDSLSLGTLPVGTYRFQLRSLGHGPEAQTCPFTPLDTLSAHVDVQPATNLIRPTASLLRWRLHDLTGLVSIHANSRIRELQCWDLSGRVHEARDWQRPTQSGQVAQFTLPAHGLWLIQVDTDRGPLWQKVWWKG